MLNARWVAIAFALNGVSIYSGAVDGQCNKVDVDDDTSEWTSFDFCSGHVAPGGDYHYHFPPTCLVTQAMEFEGKTASDHSPQIGWAFDGFPIYGPYGSGGNLMSNANSCSGSYCLDECSGKEEELPSVDKFKYRYYITGAIGDLSSLPGDPKPSADDYPFTLNCYKGCQWDELSSGACSGDQGVSDSYSATALSGYTTKYVAPNNLQCGSGESNDAGPDEDTSSTTPRSWNDAGTSRDPVSNEDVPPTRPGTSNDAGVSDDARSNDDTSTIPSSSNDTVGITSSITGVVSHASRRPSTRWLVLMVWCFSIANTRSPCTEA